ncbi:class I SAM-dependent methyltransferase [Brevibacillus marinus]|uniref:class I SAM-dependent methyltransferase n=1 Tax=Brevibacillus marinus TaxID=2496837 RepID=UPI000F817DD8|nr:class I SAM-dependent methyltransferase [Brevibacillus marinus]
MTEAWFERSFREDYLLVYRHRDEASADQEIANLLDHLPIRKSGRVLDLCCGSGRHSRALARRGYEVVGVDLSPVLLAVAEEKNTYDNLTFFQYDMREIPFVSEFDIVVNLFTSFGYFATDEENNRVVRNMATALKPGGEVVIDYLNPDYVKNHLIPTSEREVSGLTIRERRWIEDGFVKKQIVVRDAEQAEPREYLEQVRLYDAGQMERMLTSAGFHNIQLYGDYDFTAYDRQESPRMIFYARRE